MMREGVTHKPTPDSASSRQGNFSPGSRLREGATSEWASTRSRLDAAPRDDAAAERDHCCDLPLGKSG